MTNEEIKQAAEAYADSLKEIRGELEWCATRDDFIAGAHSRDGEIKYLERISTTYKVDAQDTAAECERLHDILEELRNPWISVEDRLPEEGKCVFVRYGDVSHSLYSSAYMIEKDLWSIEGYGNGEITHWMPIPAFKKGE